MTRQRDSQRKKFWLAFHQISRHQPTIIRPDTWRFAETVLDSRWWNAKRPDITKENVIFKTKNGRNLVGTLEMAPAQCWTMPLQERTTKMMILAGLCHSLPEPTTAWHGPEYCRSLLDAIQRFIDDETADELRASFKAHRVKLRSWSLEARDAAKVRYAKKELLAMSEEMSSGIPRRTAPFGRPDQNPSIMGDFHPLDSF
jgi:hypothetical protein